DWHGATEVARPTRFTRAATRGPSVMPRRTSSEGTVGSTGMPTPRLSCSIVSSRVTFSGNFWLTKRRFRVIKCNAHGFHHHQTRRRMIRFKPSGQTVAAVVAAVLVIVAGSAAVASNMGFKMNKGLYPPVAAKPGAGDNWTSIPFNR